MPDDQTTVLHNVWKRLKRLSPWAAPQPLDPKDIRWTHPAQREAWRNINSKRASAMDKCIAFETTLKRLEVPLWDATKVSRYLNNPGPSDLYDSGWKHLREEDVIRTPGTPGVYWDYVPDAVLRLVLVIEHAYGSKLKWYVSDTLRRQDHFLCAYVGARQYVVAHWRNRSNDWTRSDAAELRLHDA